MNFVKSVFILLVCLITVPSYAQKTPNTSASDLPQFQFTEALLKAHKEAHIRAMREVYGPTCVYCHQPLTPTDQYRHCPALGFTGICTAGVQTQPETYSAEYMCPECHQAYSDEERRGHIPHECNCNTTSHHHGQYCIYCGEEITQDFKECSSPNRYSKYCTTHCPTCGKDLRNPQNVGADGKHHCREKNTIPVAAEKHVSCSCSGSAHASAEKLPQTTPNSADGQHRHTNTEKFYCIYCGEEITQDFQECSSPDRLTQHCTTHCPECGKDLRHPQNVGPDGKHHCRGKFTLQVVPVK